MFTARQFVPRTTSGEFVDADGKTMQILTRFSIQETAGATASVRLMAGGSSAPSTPTGAQSATAGSVTIGNKKVKVAYVFPSGLTTPSSASASFSNDGSHQATITFTAPPLGATGTNVYLNTSGRNEVQRITLTAGNAPVNEVQTLTLTAGNAPVNEVQTLTLIAGATGDTFKLTYSAVESTAVTIPAPDHTGVTLAQIQAAINSIPALVGNCTAAGATGGPFTLTFGGSLAGTNVSAITVTSKTGAADGGVVETTPGSTDSFKLTYSAVESSIVNIPSGGFAQVTLTQIQTALTSIAALVGRYTATGSTGGPFTITFGGSLAGTDVSAITVTSKVGAADGSVAETTKGSTDSFTIAYSAVDSSVISIPAGGYASVTLSQIQTALTSIAALAGNYTATGSTGGPFDVTFNGSLADTNVSALSLTNAVGASAATFTTVTGGVAQGSTWYKGESGSSPSVAPGLTTYEFTATDAALVGYTAAPTSNTSGAVIGNTINLAANQYLSVPLMVPENGLRLRVEILSGAVEVCVAGQ